MPWPTDHLPPKIEPTIMERQMAEVLNGVQAWLDALPGTPFPQHLSVDVRAMVLFYETRRT